MGRTVRHFLAVMQKTLTQMGRRFLIQHFWRLNISTLAAMEDSRVKDVKDATQNASALYATFLHSNTNL